jgi:chaperonin cofactor prefoldin
MDGMWKLTGLLLLFLSFLLPEVTAETLPPNFKVTNEMIYQQLMELKEEHAVFKEKFNSIDKRFDQVDRRFEGLRADMNRRFEELRADMNKRFEEMDKRFEDIDKRFEDMDKRFEEMNKRFDDMFHYLNILAGIFTTLTVFVIGFAYWDRRTIISKAKEETIREIENSGKLRDLILVLREKAKTDSELERILKEHKLL